MILFFFSSRRRHTRWPRDWSSDVCSSDLNDPRQAQVVDLRYFGGLTIEETALMLDISPATVKRDWEHARAWLHREMHTSPAGLSWKATTGHASGSCSARPVKWILPPDGWPGSR